MGSVPRRFRGSFASLFGPSRKPEGAEKLDPLQTAGASLPAVPRPTESPESPKTKDSTRQAAEEGR
jgi:hypothetical protein